MINWKLSSMSRRLFPVLVICLFLAFNAIVKTRAKYLKQSSLHDGSFPGLGNPHHEGYDPKHELRISIEKQTKEHDSKDHDDDDSDSDVCEVDDDEEDDSDESSSDSDGDNDGCDVLVVDDEEDQSDPKDGTTIEVHVENITRVKDHREANDVESKQKKTSHVPDKLQVSLKTL